MILKNIKFIEAKRRLITDKIHTIVVHFDLFNGQVACVEISKIKDNDLRFELDNPPTNGRAERF